MHPLGGEELTDARIFNEDHIPHIENCIHTFDFGRLDKTLGWARDQIAEAEDEGGVFKKANLGEKQAWVLLAIYEAMCCMPYLSLPDKRSLFQAVFVKIQGKRPLKLGNNVVLPAMTMFLFEEDTSRQLFAKKAWERVSVISRDQFTWAIQDELAAVMQKVGQYGPQHGDAYPEIQRFWEGFLMMLRPLDDQLIVHCLRGMEVKPTIYDLLFLHMHCYSEGILVNILKALSGLLEKSPKAFWDAIGDARPFVVAEQVLVSPMFKALLAQSLELDMQVNDSALDVPFTISWIDVWIKSIKPHQQGDACESLLSALFENIDSDPSIGEQGRAACRRAAFNALDSVLKSHLQDESQPETKGINTATTLIYINATINLTLRYSERIATSTDLVERVYHTFQVPEAAMAVIKSALNLDSRAMVAECNALKSEQPIQQAVRRNSAALWDSFTDLLTFGGKRIELATEMLRAMIPLADAEQILRPRKAAYNRVEEKDYFNTQFDKLADVLGKVIQGLSGWNEAEWRKLSLNVQAFRSIILFSLHGEIKLREPATEFIKTLADESSRSEALLKMLKGDLTSTLGAYNFAIPRYIKKPALWGPMLHILSASRDLLGGLCDPSSGILRSSSLLSQDDDQAIASWWLHQWHLVDVAFKETEGWSHYVDLGAMQEFCREVIELAAALLAQDGLVASALTRHNSDAGNMIRGVDSTGIAANRQKMAILLGVPQKYLFGLTQMIRLKDKYLVSVTVDVLCKLLRRLREFDVEVPSEARVYLQNACVPSPEGRFMIQTNLTPQQRAELLRIVTDEDSDLEIVSIQKATKPKKQSTIDAWSKSGSSSRAGSTPEYTTPRTNRDDVLELSSTVDKKRAMLDKIAARQPKPKPLSSRPKLDSKPLLVPNAASIRESREKAKEEKRRRDAEAIARAKALRGEPTIPGEGSGLRGLGVSGKDHAPKKSEIMVDSSEDEDEDEESDGDIQFASLIKSTSVGRHTMTEAERRRERALLDKTRMPVKKVKQQRSAKDLRARLIPPMDTLHQAILDWDIFHEGNDPPNIVERKEVSNTYQQATEYKQTFLPLLISEAWRSFVTSKDETTFKPFGIKVATRMNVDRFLELTGTMPITENKDRSLSEGDILLLSKSMNPLNDNEMPHCLARIWKITYKKDLIEVTYRLSNKSNPLSPTLAPNVSVYAVKITNMTTIEREYAALESLQYYDLIDEILQAQPSPILKYGDEAIQSVMSNYHLNPGQAKAILCANANDGFTLVQG
jgi:senataxin